MELAREGCNIAVLDMDLSGAERTCHDIRQLGVNAMPYEVRPFRLLFGAVYALTSVVFSYFIRLILATTRKWSL